MSLFEFMFPQQAAASHLRQIANRQKRDDRWNRIRETDQTHLENRVDELEHDMGVVALILASILDTANENGTISRDEIKRKIEELDVLDGFRDGRLHVGFLRKWTEENGA
ncbi:MAG: hypothetical protein AB8B55_12595 [Mariniblastus sp.]